MRRRFHKVFDPNERLLILHGRIPMVALVQTLAVAEYLNFVMPPRHLASASPVSARA